MIEEFKKARPNDVSLNIAIGGDRRTMTYSVFNDWASSNTCSDEFARGISEGQHVAISRKIEIETKPIGEIMEEYFPEKAPEFLNIDVENLDYEVLSSTDWERFRPLIVAVEDFEYSANNPGISKIYKHLSDRGYLLFSRTIYTNFFIEHSFNDAYFRFA